MNRFLLVIMTICSLAILTSCNKDRDFTTDELLIMEIKESNAKIAVENEVLPSNIKEEVDREYFETYIETASLVEEKGYELILGSNNAAYFNKEGRRLKWRKKGRKGGKGCDAEEVAIADLPQTIADYITNNYPNAVIKGAKFLDGRAYLVGLDTKEILVFDEHGIFIKVADCIHHCDKGEDMGETVASEDLPTAITSYINTNYPNAVIRVAFTKEGKFAVVLVENDSKILLGFDENGVLLFTK